MKTIPLTQGKEALVSDCDYEFLMQWKWEYHKCNHGDRRLARRRRPRPERKVIYMHRAIAGRKGLSGEIDHRDRNNSITSEGTYGLRQARKIRASWLVG